MDKNKNKAQKAAKSKQLVDESSQIFMVQHYNKIHNAFVQHIKNNSESQICITKTTLHYRNMLQMGDSPFRKSEPIVAVASPRAAEINEKFGLKDIAGEEDEQGAKFNNNLISDIKNFDINVYDVITKNVQNYSVEHTIEPSESCTLILRQVRGGLKSKKNANT